MKPIGAPDPVETPAEALQDVLAKAIPFARLERGVIGGTVTFNGQDVAARLFGVPHAQIDPKASSPNLVIARVAKMLDHVSHIGLERAVGQLPCRLRLGHLPATRKLEEPLEDPRAITTGSTGVDVIGIKRAEDNTARRGTRVEYVQAPFTALAIHWPE